MRLWRIVLRHDVNFLCFGLFLGLHCHYIKQSVHVSPPQEEEQRKHKDEQDEDDDDSDDDRHVIILGGRCHSARYKKHNRRREKLDLPVIANIS